jgi:hypothetical protein
VLFTDNRFIGQEAAEPKRCFAGLFPSIFKILNEIKKHGNNLLPILLQQIESNSILRTVTKELRVIEPSMPLYTLHDSIVTTEDYSVAIHDVMEHFLKEEIGVKPLLKLEYWHPYNLQFSDGESYWKRLTA